ncbi:hypothetical protein CYY_003442 [Polysphondylium violaceum]|uniref:ubiquitinyl hydrolase 1 n=1 Tax=Polysphondylium violaceum TaxID=133409 RepID=A0A8J4Q6U3_9MYCE|nr:hypothetical protein CYY_003442 [Polysphondylium violaceum]
MSEDIKNIRYLTDFVKNCNDPKEIEKVLDHIIENLPFDQKTERDDYFDNLETLSEFIEIIWLKVGGYNSDMVSKLDTFFKHTINMILQKLVEPEFSSDHLKTLMVIFSPKPSRYYQSFENDIYQTISEHEAKIFVENDGFVLLTNRIENFKCSFETIKNILNTIKKLTKKYDKIELNQIEHLINIVFQKILNYSDEEFKNENKKDLDLIVKSLTGIVNNQGIENNLHEMIQHSNLQVYLKCFKSPSLEKRNAGLNDIIRFCRHDNHGFMLRNQPSFNYFPPNKISEWIKENQVIETLYGETMHIQLIQKCTDILKFLAEHSAFERKYLDLIWNAAEGKHETIENVIYDTIGNIASSLPVEDIDYLFDKVSKIPYSHYTQHTLHLIRALTQRITSDSNYIPKGVEILWNLIQDSCEVNIDLAEQALGSLQDSLTFFPNLKAEYLKKSIETIENHQSVILCLRLIYFVITSLSGRKKGLGFNNNNNNNNNNHLNHQELDLPTIISQVEEQYHLVELLFKHMVFYNQKCKEILKNNIYAGYDESSLRYSTFVGKYSHTSQVYDYLNFLGFIYEKSSLVLHQDYIDILWNTFVVSPILVLDRGVFFGWIEKNLMLKKSEILYFLSKFQNLAFDDLDIAGVNFYIFCMTAIKEYNTMNRAQHHHQQQTQPTTGLDDLWRIVLQARDEEVGKIAIAYLIEQYTRSVKFPEDFLAACMTRLANVPTQEGAVLDDSTRILVTRCLSLIKRFLEDFGPRISDSFKRHYSPQILVHFSSQKHPRFSLEIKSNETIGNLKYLVSHKVGIASPHCICFSHQGKIMLEDHETLELFRVSNGDTISFQEISEPRHSEPMHCIHIDFDQNNFELLFSLLNYDSKIAQDVWELLMLLPVNQHILHDITHLSTTTTIVDIDDVDNGNNNNNSNNNSNSAVNWNNILDPSSSYKLLYSLQIIESMISPNSNPTNPSSSVTSANWKQKFINSGGANHLINGILMSVDLQSESRGSKKNICLAMLLRVLISIFETDNFRVESIAMFVDPVLLFTRLINLTWNQAVNTVEEDNFSPHETEDATVISLLMRIIVNMVENSSQLFNVFISNKDILKWISLLALDSKDLFIREKVCWGLMEICQKVDPSKSQPFFLSKSLELLFTNIEKDRRSSTCSNFFEVICYLLKERANGSGNDDNEIIKDSELLLKLIQMIKTQPIVESTTAYQSDYLLIGLLSMVKILIEANSDLKLVAGQQGLVKEIFFECLFNIATSENHGPTCPPKAKTKDTRDICFSVLLELSKDCTENFKQVTELLMDHHKPDEKRTLWSYFPAGNEKSTCGYVGLKNLGATCYINSLLQQFFMIPGFRYNIIQSEDRYPSIQDQQDSLLYQLKVIFSNLQESEKKSHDPKDFCLAYKYDGRPINTDIQMDVDEFFNMLFDKLENTLKGTPQEKLLQDFFGGTSVNQFISQECNHVSEREEPYYTISVEVKNKKEIQESLQLFVESEVLDGDNKYFCSSCSQKVKALMRRCIKKLPNNLIIHNKRFEFDLDLMKRTKLNDALKFPMTIDMAPYTKEFLERKEAIEKAKANGDPIPPDTPEHPPNYYQYELSGILVHNGNADSGHYYSYIKEREPLVEGQPRRWILFNDQLTEVFNPDEISKACFGGYDQSDQGKSSNFRTGPRVHNAYMLFYERSYVEGENNKKYQNVKCSEASKLVPKDMFSSVWKKNMKFLNDKNIFDPNYFNFVLNTIKFDSMYKPTNLNSPMDYTLSQQDDNNNGIMVKSQQQQPQFDHLMRSIELGTRFLIETLFHSKDRKLLGDTVLFLQRALEEHTQGCYWFLNAFIQDPLWIRQNFLVCITHDPREALMKLLLSVIKKLLPLERPLYFELDESTPINHNSNNSHNSNIVNNSNDSLMIDIDDSNNTVNKPNGKGKQKAITQMIEDDVYSTLVFPKSKSVIVQFMDIFLDYIKEAPTYWKHFNHYFMFIKEFALLGRKEREYLVSRRVIGRLIDFFLGDESPWSKSHPPQKKTKMGDKYSSPQFNYMMDALSILVRSCHTNFTKDHPDKQFQLPGMILDEPDQGLIFMPEEDMELLYDPIFIAKVIRENNQNVHSKTISEIISYICYNDMDATTNIIEYFNSVEQSRALDALYPLIVLDDNERENRVQIAIQPYLQILEANFPAKNAVLHFKGLVESAIANDFINQWFVKNLSQWAFTYLLDSEISEVRAEAFNLLVHIARMGTPNAELNQEFIVSIFNYLLDQIKQCRKILKREKDLKNFRLEHYFKFLRLCLVVKENKEHFCKVASSFYALMLDILLYQTEIDRNRQEVTHFAAEVLKENPFAIEQLLKEQLSQKLMEYYISISSKDDLKHFNQRSLPYFYEILYVISQHDVVFLESVVTHSNFEWANKFLLCECADYADAAKFLFAISQLAVAKVPHVLSKFLKGIVSFENVFYYAPNSLALIDLITPNRKEAITFLESKGFIVFAQRLLLPTTPDNFKYYPKALDLLYKIVNNLKSGDRSPPVASQNSTQIVGESSNKSSDGGTIAIVDDNNSGNSGNSNNNNSLLNSSIGNLLAQGLKSVIFSTLDIMEINDEICAKGLKLLNLIASEYPDNVVVFISEYYDKRPNRKAMENQRLMNAMQQQQYPPAMHHHQHHPSLSHFNSNTQHLLKYLTSIVDILCLILAAHPTCKEDNKASLTLSKIIRDIYIISTEDGTALLKHVSKHLRSPEKKGFVDWVLISHTALLENEQIFEILKTFVQPGDVLASGEVEVQIGTFIASIQSLEDPNTSPDADNLFESLVASLKAIELLMISASKNDELMNSWKVFADSCNINSDKAKTFLLEFKSLLSKYLNK